MTTPSLPELLRRAIESRLGDLHVAIPGIVHASDPAKQTVDVQVAVKRPVENDDGEFEGEDIGIVQNVPVSWPGGGGFSIQFPLVPGDTGLLVFCTRGIGEWRETGSVSTPQDIRLHGLSYSIFIPGIVPNTALPPDPPAAGSGVIRVNGTLRVGGPSADYVALAAKVDAQFQSIADAFSHAVPAPPAPPDAGEPGLLAVQSALAAGFQSVAATKLKAE